MLSSSKPSYLTKPTDKTWVRSPSVYTGLMNSLFVPMTTFATRVYHFLFSIPLGDPSPGKH